MVRITISDNTIRFIKFTLDLCCKIIRYHFFRLKNYPEKITSGADTDCGHAGETGYGIDIIYKC